MSSTYWSVYVFVPNSNPMLVTGCLRKSSLKMSGWTKKGYTNFDEDDMLYYYVRPPTNVPRFDEDESYTIMFKKIDHIHLLI